MTETYQANKVEDFICPQLLDVARDAIKDGLEVYVSPESIAFPGLRTYFYITDGKNIGSCEYSRLEGICFSTLHMPSCSNGTGARSSDGWVYFPGIIREVRASLAIVPNWWRYGEVQKYADFNHFNRHKFKGELIKVTI